MPVSEDDYQRKLEEQKKIREKIKAMKEKKRQEAAESRRKELVRRLMEEGWSLGFLLRAMLLNFDCRWQQDFFKVFSGC